MCAKLAKNKTKNSILEKKKNEKQMDLKEKSVFFVFVIVISPGPHTHTHICTHANRREYTQTPKDKKLKKEHTHN